MGKYIACVGNNGLVTGSHFVNKPLSFLEWNLLFY